jgi:hypothetical protein
MPTTKKKKSGSAKLNASRKGPGASAGTLKAIVAALDRSGIKNKILIRGIPIPDIITGTITAATPGQAASAVSILLKAQNVQYKPVKLFPKGIPIPDIIRVEVDGRLIK